MGSGNLHQEDVELYTLKRRIKNLEEENILNRNFAADSSRQKMVSDITYIPTDKGWLYLTGHGSLRG